MAKHGVIYILNNKIRDGDDLFKVGRTRVTGVRGRNEFGAYMPKRPAKQWVIGVEC